jgi:hypothetical protein
VGRAGGRGAGRPPHLQKALAYTIPTSQLTALLPLAAVASDLQQPAIQLLKYRLRPRLAGPIWENLQDAPDNAVFCDLLLTLSASLKAAYPGELPAGLPACIRLTVRTLAAAGEGGLADADLPAALISQLMQVDLPAAPAVEVLRELALDPASRLAGQLFLRFFSQCDAATLHRDRAVLAAWLAAARPAPWAVLNHYAATVPPDAWFEAIGDQIEQALRDTQQEPAACLPPPAMRNFLSWRKLISLRRLLHSPRQIALLSRFRFLFTEPARQLTPETVVILLRHLVLVLRAGEETFYLYPAKLFTETWSRLQEQEEPAAAWPVDYSLVVPARQALLQEQDKRPEEKTQVEELEHNLKMSIIQMDLDDAHYLFARKLFEEIALYEGLRPE